MEPAHSLFKNNFLFVTATHQQFDPELGRRIRTLVTGVGPTKAAIGVSLHLLDVVSDGNKPDLVVSLGSAGSRRCETGTIWQVSSASWRDMDTTRWPYWTAVLRPQSNSFGPHW